MKILIVEDDQFKIESLAGLLSERLGALVETTEARSYTSGAIALSSSSFDLALLDMSMPTYDKNLEEAGGPRRIYGGQDILRQMKRKRILTPAILVTQFESFGEEPNTVSLRELSKSLFRDFPEMYKGYVYFNASYDDWRDELASLINVVMKT